MTKLLSIRGMSCEHCVKHVKESLEELTAVISADVNLKEETATVHLSREVENIHLTEVIDDAGYDLVEISDID